MYCRGRWEGCIYINKAWAKEENKGKVGQRLIQISQLTVLPQSDSLNIDIEGETRAITD